MRIVIKATLVLGVIAFVWMLLDHPRGSLNPTLASPAGAASPSQYGQNEEIAFIAAEAERDLWSEQVRAANVLAVTQGLERKLAGFHLVRPDDDPYWTTEHGNLGCSGGVFCWYIPQLRYQGVHYNRLLGPGGIPVQGAFSLPQYCELSLDRILSNALAQVSATNSGGSPWTVVARFGQREIAALASMINPKYSAAQSGPIDWFGTPRAQGTSHTSMRVVVVSDDMAYLPFLVQDIVAQAPGPVSVVIARDLSEQDATKLVARLQKR